MVLSRISSQTVKVDQMPAGCIDQLVLSCLHQNQTIDWSCLSLGRARNEDQSVSFCSLNKDFPGRFGSKHVKDIMPPTPMAPDVLVIGYVCAAIVVVSLSSQKDASKDAHLNTFHLKIRLNRSSRADCRTCEQYP